MNRRMNLIVFGGGTGLSSLVRGLKERELNLTAVVTITDEGGSSGTIRREMKIPPPGDVRNNITAFAEDENLLTKLIQFRFKDEGTFEGHSVGNIILAALTKILGSFPDAVKSLSKVLAIEGEVLPISEELVRLKAKNDQGETLIGEKEIEANKGRIITLESDKKFQPLPEVIERIQQADGIILGPGSLYTSIIPNLIAEGVSDNICACKAPVIYICNIMTQPGETIHYSMADHANEIRKYLGKHPDYYVVNSQPIAKKLLKRYKARGADQVELRFESLNGAIIMENLIKSVVDERDGFEKVRHDEQKLGEMILKIMGWEREN
ncbi:MAG: gluconeogenesis factor YvcK family protein [Thermotogota bacterium]